MRARTLALVLCCVSAPVSALSAFRFQIPAGFEDISPGTPGANLPGLPDALKSELASGRYAAFAMDLREADGFAENFNAVVTKGALRVDEAFATESAAKLPIEYAKAFGGTVNVREQGLVTLGGFPAFRIVFDVQTQQLSMRQLQYFVPGASEYAILTYSATPDSFASYLPTFESAAMATEGAAAPKLFDWSGVLRSAISGAGIAVVVGLLVQLTRRKRATPARPPMRSMPRRR